MPNGWNNGKLLELRRMDVMRTWTGVYLMRIYSAEFSADYIFMTRRPSSLSATARFYSLFSFLLSYTHIYESTGQKDKKRKTDVLFSFFLRGRSPLDPVFITGARP